ncbi:MAG: biopolymer transporter ExbD, partial [Myxococcales bacterium]|nr:biopolymer transporter ExbD [Myxococcales bacterium]
MAGGGTPSDDGGAVSDINVTPMVDVLLSLLIIFMVATPQQNAQMPITVPSQAPQQNPNDPDAMLLISIDAAGKAKLGESDLSDDFDAMVEQLKKNEKLQSDGKVAIDADPKTPYGRVIVV